MNLSISSIPGVLVVGVVILSTTVTSSLLAQEVDFILETATTVAAPGESFSVTVQLENLDAISIQGIQHVVSWDSSRLQLLSLTLPGDLEGSPTNIQLSH